MAASPWPVIHAEREALAADLEPLDDSQWRTQSLCQDWSVREVLGHMTATAKMSPLRFFTKLAGSGFRFSVLQARDISQQTAGTPAQTLAEFRRVMTGTGHPPGPIDTMLGEVIIHSADIRRPLGLQHDYPTAAVVRVADFFKGSNVLIGSKKRIAGLRLRATDADWSTGSGPVLSLALAMTGRAEALDDLSGDGLSTLRSRSRPAAHG